MLNEAGDQSAPFDFSTREEGGDGEGCSVSGVASAPASALVVALAGFVRRARCTPFAVRD